MSGESALVSTFKVGRWTVTITMPRVVAGAVVCGSCEWDPALPGRPLTPSEERQYSEGLRAAIEAFDLARQGL